VALYGFAKRLGIRLHHLSFINVRRFTEPHKHTLSPGTLPAVYNVRVSYQSLIVVRPSPAVSNGPGEGFAGFLALPK